MGILKSIFGKKPKTINPAERIGKTLNDAGYSTMFELPENKGDVVELLVQSMMTKLSCESDGTFETGEKNPARILCSDNKCPCTDKANLLIGTTAYIYISEAVVDFRKDCRTLLELDIKLKCAYKGSSVSLLLVDRGFAKPFYLCERGARRRGLDLAASLADAKTVAESGFAPLRPTPRSQI